jgi:hypothetical protein
VAAGSPFLQLANTILKLAELDDRSRGAVMLSRTMQQIESERAGIPVKRRTELREANCSER